MTKKETNLEKEVKALLKKHMVAEAGTLVAERLAQLEATEQSLENALTENQSLRDQFEEVSRDFAEYKRGIEEMSHEFTQKMKLVVQREIDLKTQEAQLKEDQKALFRDQTQLNLTIAQNTINNLKKHLNSQKEILMNLTANAVYEATKLKNIAEPCRYDKHVEEYSIERSAEQKKTE